jgi:hypothetical protein
VSRVLAMPAAWPEPPSTRELPDESRRLISYDRLGGWPGGVRAAAIGVCVQGSGSAWRTEAWTIPVRDRRDAGSGFHRTCSGRAGRRRSAGRVAAWCGSRRLGGRTPAWDAGSSLVEGAKPGRIVNLTDGGRQQAVIRKMSGNLGNVR